MPNPEVLSHNGLSDTCSDTTFATSAHIASPCSAGALRTNAAK
jgi:hypothetical protein